MQKIILINTNVNWNDNHLKINGDWNRIAKQEKMGKIPKGTHLFPEDIMNWSGLVDIFSYRGIERKVALERVIKQEGEELLPCVELFYSFNTRYAKICGRFPDTKITINSEFNDEVIPKYEDLRKLILLEHEKFKENPSVKRANLDYFKILISYSSNRNYFSPLLSRLKKDFDIQEWNLMNEYLQNL